ncbi:MAG: BMP family ABC transporter substrate-binding protein, partial [Spirochaetes bacterium]|nr:BMP family ABC transporter substrate-binding protein [Spirochaetota bacterium]
NSPKEAFEVIDNLYNKMKFDIVYAVAAGTNLGVFNACKKNNIFSIGVDADQDYLVPGVILTSAMKRLDNAIVLIIDLIINNKLEPKNYVLGLKEDCVSLTEMKYTKEIIGNKVLNQIEDIKKRIINGEILIKTVFNY